MEEKFVNIYKLKIKGICSEKLPFFRETIKTESKKEKELKDFKTMISKIRED